MISPVPGARRATWSHHALRWGCPPDAVHGGGKRRADGMGTVVGGRTHLRLRLLHSGAPLRPVGLLPQRFRQLTRGVKMERFPSSPTVPAQAVSAAWRN